MADSVGTVQRVLAQDFFNVTQLAWGTPKRELFFTPGADGDAG
jgi:hypothetical protein